MGPEPTFNPYSAPSEDAEGLVSEASHELDIPAKRMTRLVASMVDGLLYVVAVLPGILLMGSMTDSQSEPSPLEILGFPTGIVLALYQCFLIAQTGQSLAKRWFHIRIVRLDGSLPGFLHGVVLRAWPLAAVQFIPVVGNILFFVDALTIFNADRRCLHDRLAGTMVIESL